MERNPARTRGAGAILAFAAGAAIALLAGPPSPVSAGPQETPPPAAKAEGHRINSVFLPRFEKREEVFRRMGTRAFGPESEQAVADALDWLARHQDSDGRWSCAGYLGHCQGLPCPGGGGPQYDVAVTGLSLLAFLGTGATPDRPGPHQEVVRRGIDWLVSVQDPDGCFGERRSGHFPYNHSIALLAVAEAAALTGSPACAASMREGVRFSLAAQNPGAGWRYGVRPGDSDSSVTGWMCLGLQAAEWAGVSVPEVARAGATRWFDQVTEPEFGRVGYTAMGNGPARPPEKMDAYPADLSESLTALAAAVRILAGGSPAERSTAGGLELVRKCPPSWAPGKGSIDFYYWFWGSLATFQAGGFAWDTWQQALVKALVANQNRLRTEHRFGSWEPLDPWNEEGGRIYSTALCALALESPYRLARLSDQPADATRLSLATDPPGARVFLDGKEVGTTPFRDARFTEGTSRVAILHPACADSGKEIECQPLETTDGGTLALPPGAFVNLALFPPDAAVYHEGRRLQGSAPVRPGKVRLLVLEPKCWARVAVQKAKAGETLSVLLDPMGPGKAPLWSGAAWDSVPPPPVPDEAPPSLGKGFRSVEGRIWCEKDGAEMVLVPARPEERPDIPPEKKVFPLLWDRCEITVGQYRRFAADAKRKVPPQPPGAGTDHPVVGVTAEDAAAYARWAGKRLPRPDEWEWAALGFLPRDMGYPVPGFPWGLFDSPEARLLPGSGKILKGPEKVGSFPAGMNESGLLDMIGNAAEWCSGKTAPRLLGGSWRNASPSRAPLKGDLADAGFRCVANAGK